MTGPSLPNPWDLFYVFLKGSRVSMMPAHKSQSGRAGGRTGQQEESPNAPGKGGQIAYPRSGAAAGQGGLPPGLRPSLGRWGQPGSGPDRGSISSCCLNKQTNRQKIPVRSRGSSLLYQGPFVLTQFPRHFQRRCRRPGQANCAVDTPPTSTPQPPAAKPDSAPLLTTRNT